MSNQDLMLERDRELVLLQSHHSISNDDPDHHPFGIGYAHHNNVLGIHSHTLNFSLEHHFDDGDLVLRSRNPELQVEEVNLSSELALGPTLNLDNSEVLDATEDAFQDHNDHGGSILEQSDALTEQHDELVMQQQAGLEMVKSQALVEMPKSGIVVGQEFPDVMSCRRAVRNAAISGRFEIHTVKSDKTRFTTRCASQGCPWRVHAAKLRGLPTFTIRTIVDDHTCAAVTQPGQQQQASIEWVANSIEESLFENPSYKPRDMPDEVSKFHGNNSTYKQTWRGKDRVMPSMRGSSQDEYCMLPQYCEQIKRTNPGSIASVYGNVGDNCFRRLFVSYSASIYGFINACCPLVALGRIPLKNKYLGTLLLATGFDGNGDIFPVAFGIVDEENDENWIWFLSELHNLLESNTENMPQLTILSDRRKGIVDGVDFNFPTAFHGYCMHHLTETFQKQFNNSMLVNLLWEAARALTVFEFEAKVREIEEISQEAAFWIRRINPRLWATAYFEGTRFGHLTASSLESLTNWILEISGLPIIQMMESIRRQLMIWFNERREASMQWLTVLVPCAEVRTSEALEYARGLSVVRVNEAEFQVMSSVDQPMVVDIRNRCCFCRGWQLYGLPCAHAVAALLSCRQNVHRFSDKCFTVSAYRKAYSQTIHPIPDRRQWKELSESAPNSSDCVQVVICPPKLLKPGGKPRKKRVQTEDRGREKRIVHCSRCNQIGHFKTTCATPV